MTVSTRAAVKVDAPRTIERVIKGSSATDGAGVRIRRLLTQDLQRRLDPFLMLDLFGSDSADDYIAGFPDHPHRGFETITFMLEGRTRHRDSAGNEGLLQNGGVQWMTAGRGVIHSEMPEQTEGRMEGFQLWLNLPGREKMCAPWYRDSAAAELPRFETEQGACVQVIAGETHGVAGAVQRQSTAVSYLDISLSAGGIFEHPLPPDHNAFVVAYRGEVGVPQGRPSASGQTLLNRGEMAIFANQGDGVRLSSAAGGRAILISGRPLGEPIAQYGPFVMNTSAEIQQAIADFRAGVLA